MQTGLRTDIQALRGLAVLLVILQHARAGFIGAGFLGVDIFFVISGFLMTGLLARDIGAGHFNVLAFYFRRAKRLLPAAYVTFVVTAIAAFFLLDALEWRDFTRQLAGAVTFTGNVVLLHQTGYFEGAAALKPLLHVWSLAIEEQYYLLLPAALVLVPRRWWTPATALVLVASLGLCMAWTATRPDAAFYLLPTRAWELAIGSLAALLAGAAGERPALVSRLFGPALATVLVIPIWPLPLANVANIALVCVATALVILRRHDALQDRPVPNALARVGDASYSLYLAHWPVFALLNNVYAGDPALGRPGPWILAAATALALALGALLYRRVELPVRRMEFQSPRRWLLFAGVLSGALAMVPTTLAASAGFAGATGVDYAELRRDNLGFDSVCDGYQRLEYTQRCSNSAHPAILVWGDSFAMHLVAGIAASSDAGILQATKSACGPLPGLAQIAGPYTRAFAERCIGFNQSVLEYLQATPSIRVVVLSSPFYPYFDPGRRMLHVVDGVAVEQAPDAALAGQVLRDTISRVRAMGKRVVIVAPPPSDGFDYTHCLERRARHRSLVGHWANCNVPIGRYHASKRQVLTFLAQVGRQADVAVVSFDPLLCDPRECATELAGRPLYRDEGHLSNQGSIIVGRAMHLGSRLLQAAR